MKIDINKVNEETIVIIEGRLDTVTAPELERLVRPLYEESGIKVVFDCNTLEYVSSSGLRVVLTAHKMLTAKGSKFGLRGLIPEVRSVFDLTGFSRILTIE